MEDKIIKAYEEALRAKDELISHLNAEINRLRSNQISPYTPISPFIPIAPHPYPWQTPSYPGITITSISDKVVLCEHEYETSEIPGISGAPISSMCKKCGHFPMPQINVNTTVPLRVAQQ